MSPQLVILNTMLDEVSKQISEEEPQTVADAQGAAMAICGISAAKFVLQRLDTIATSLETLANKTS